MTKAVFPTKPHLVYTPADWYWAREDGAVWSSAKGDYIAPAGDTAYLEWTARGNRPTTWPRDDDGAQTDAALHEVLSPHGLGIGLHAARDAALAEVMAHLEAKSFRARATASIGAVDDPKKLAAVVKSLKADIDQTSGE